MHDQDIAAGLRAKDESAFRELVASHGPGLYSFLLYRLRNHDNISLTDEMERRAVSPEAGPERQAQSRQVSQRFQQALASLPEEQREVFLMREYGGLSFAEIAKSLGCPLGTALARMRYAVLKLRRELEEFHA